MLRVELYTFVFVLLLFDGMLNGLQSWSIPNVPSSISVFLYLGGALRVLLWRRAKQQFQIFGGLFGKVIVL